MEHERKKQLELLNQRLSERRKRRLQRQNNEAIALEDTMDAEEAVAFKDLEDELKDVENDELHRLEVEYNQRRLQLMRDGDTDELERLKRRFEEEQERIRQRRKDELARQKGPFFLYVFSDLLVSV